MTVEIFENQPSTTVTSGGTTAPSSGTAESWTVASSSPFPAASSGATPPTQFHVADVATGLQSETIAVTNVSGTTWTVTRGAENTVPVAHAAGFTITQVVSAGGLEGFGQLPAVNTWTGSQYFKSGRPWFDVDAYGADPTGSADSTTAFMAAINAVTGGTTVTSGNFTTDVTAVRVAKGILHMSPGTYKVSADLNIISVQGFHLAGAGPEATLIQATGTGFTNGVINIDGSDNGVFEGFTLKGDGTEQASNGLILQWDSTLAARSTSQNRLSDIRVRNLKFVSGINLGFTAAGAPQVDGTLFSNVLVSGGQTANAWSTSGNWQKAIVLGNGNSGDQYDHVLLNVSWSNCYYGLYCNTSGFELFGSQPGSNAVDFYIAPAAQICVQGVQSQNSGQFILGAGGSGSNKVAIRDSFFDTSFLISTGKWVAVTGGCASWLFDNVQCNTFNTGGAGGLGVPLMAFNGNGTKENVTLINVSQMAPPSTGVTLTSGGSLVCVGYVQLNSSQQVGTLFPIWCLGSSALYSQGTATSQPSATAYGEGWYWATDTLTLSHSNGSSWTTVDPATGSISGVTVSGTPTAGQALVATSSTAADWQTVAGAVVQDPLSLGFIANFDATTSVTTTTTTASDAYYMRLKAGGYSISSLNIFIQVSSGNISVAAYTNSGAGVNAKPTGGLLATSGAVACPAIGMAAVSLGSSVSPNITDWVALSTDNATTSFYMLSGGIAQSLGNGLGYTQAAHSDTSCTTQSGGSANVVLDASASTTNVGFGISNANIPANTTITAATPGTNYTISANATAAASGLTCVIGPHPLPSTPTVTAGAESRFILVRGS